LRPLDVVTNGTGSAKLAEALLDYCHGSTEFTVLWPCARDAQRDFVHILETAGANVIEWPVYATEFIPPRLLRSRLEHLSSFDIVVFAAPSAVKSLKETWPETWTFTSVAIGETTAEVLNKHAMTRCITSRSPHPADLVAAIKQALNDREGTSFTSTPKERS
jgi:uroporphyrinogen-III synthase